MLTSEAKKPLTIPPKELLDPPGGLNPTVLLFFAVVTMLVLSSCGYWIWEWPHWLCFGINTLSLHFSGTIIHDACHQSAHRNRIANAILGHASALVLAFASQFLPEYIYNTMAMSIIPKMTQIIMFPQVVHCG